MVQQAFRLEQPEPRFFNPFLPQWTKLVRQLTLARVKKKRAADKGIFLTMKRGFNKWQYAMTVDRGVPVSPEAIALMHYERSLTGKCTRAWYSLIRDRGVIQRVRDRCFFRWKRYAPLNRKTKMQKKKFAAWHLLWQQKMGLKSMMEICQKIVSVRISTMVTLRKNIFNRKIILCGFALMNRNSNVIMTDAWRRWVKWWKGRLRWKSTLWQYRYLWHSNKIQTIFVAWRDFMRAGGYKVHQHHHHGGIIASEESLAPSSSAEATATFAASADVQIPSNFNTRVQPTNTTATVTTASLAKTDDARPKGVDEKSKGRDDDESESKEGDDEENGSFGGPNRDDEELDLDDDNDAGLLDDNVMHRQQTMRRLDSLIQKELFLEEKHEAKLLGVDDGDDEALAEARGHIRHHELHSHDTELIGEKLGILESHQHNDVDNHVLVSVEYVAFFKTLMTSTLGLLETMQTKEYSEYSPPTSQPSNPQTSSGRAISREHLPPLEAFLLV